MCNNDNMEISVDNKFILDETFAACLNRNAKQVNMMEAERIVSETMPVIIKDLKAKSNLGEFYLVLREQCEAYKKLYAVEYKLGGKAIANALNEQLSKLGLKATSYQDGQFDSRKYMISFADKDIGKVE